MTESTNPWPEIGERLKWHRTQIAGLDQKAYASKAGINKTQYGNWETGYSHISMGGARKLMKTYNLSLDFVVFGNTAALSESLFRAWMDRPSDSNTH